MTGLELSKLFWEQEGRPAFEAACPEILDRCAVGLVGEGSECFGYDDEISRDHDWGPGFCLWLDKEDMRKYGAEARRIYASLPTCFNGWQRLRAGPMTDGRVGVIGIDDFYSRFTAIGKLPETNEEWNCVPETGLAAATNGRVFFDSTGGFSEKRSRLLGHYPEDVFRKRLAAHCAIAAQSGQYNLYRCLERNDSTAVFMTCAKFIDSIQAVVFLLNRRYRPYYKWAARAMAELPDMGAEISGLIAGMTSDLSDAAVLAEEISQRVIGMLRRQGLTDSTDDYLLRHAEMIQRSIGDPHLRMLHIMQP